MDTTKIAIGAIIVLSITLLIISFRSCRTQAETDAAATGATLMGFVKGIEGNAPAERRLYIKTKLKEFDVPFALMPFDTVLLRSNGRADTIRGENIVVTIGNRNRKIVVGAHCDAVPGSPGANDNGGGVAVVLELIRTVKDMPLNHSIDFCFFDQEESGLIGSATYVKRRDQSFFHLAMINLDVEGTGDEIYVGPVGGGDDDLLMKYVHEARDKTKYPYVEHEIYPGSDHESFAQARLENISISVVVKGDGEKLAKWVKSGYRKIERPEDMPEVLKVMHSPRDSSEFVSPDALNMSYVFAKTTLLLLDQSEP
ncbi:MAG TPA: M28 family metallopeptidase [Bacteroidota bacterium]|jgi:hypothetical protein|nr:M28 family metallopeptidase [Bacteroidota bacterium]